MENLYHTETIIHFGCYVNKYNSCSSVVFQTKQLLVNVCRAFVMSHTCCKLANTEIVMISTLTFVVIASLR